MNRFLNKVWCEDARKLLAALPTESIDAVIADAMYGTSKNFKYEWGLDPAKGDPEKHWQYHEPIYRECLRVLKPGGALAWGQGAKFIRYFPKWFSGHRVWTLTRFSDTAFAAVGNVWIVQTKEQQPIEFPPGDSLVMFDRKAHLPWRKIHPCPKPVEEMMFLVGSLTKPGQTILDCCCGIGATLLAANRMNRNWIGCDLSRRYCQVAMKRLAHPDWLPSLATGGQSTLASKECLSLATEADENNPRIVIPSDRNPVRAKVNPCLGRDHAQCDPDDFYPTPPHATSTLLKYEDFGRTVWEPACGAGAMAEVLKQGGYDVIASDSVDRGYGDVQDFLTSNRNVESIVTNPPFKVAEPFIRHALSLTSNKVAMFLRLLFLESKGRYSFFQETPLKHVYVFTQRVKFHRGGVPGKGGSAVAYAWYVWQHGYKGEPTIRWFAPDAGKPMTPDSMPFALRSSGLLVPSFSGAV